MKSFNDRLIEIIRIRNSRLCVGLDVSPDRIGVSENDLKSVMAYTRKVVEATRGIAVAYKPNLAFFERWGAEGWTWLNELRAVIGDSALVIADAKRGDIGSTARHYAESILSRLGADAVTVNPYLGPDSIEPFCRFPEKGVFVLCRTSNPGGAALQLIGESKPVFAHVAKWAVDLNRNNNLGLVVGATVGEDLKTIRNLAPDLPFLIPGIGAQGGSIRDCLNVRSKRGAILVNVSRGIMLAGDHSSEAIRAAAETYRYQLNGDR